MYANAILGSECICETLRYDRNDCKKSSKNIKPTHTAYNWGQLRHHLQQFARSLNTATKFYQLQIEENKWAKVWFKIQVKKKSSEKKCTQGQMSLYIILYNLFREVLFCKLI